MKKKGLKIDNFEGFKEVHLVDGFTIMESIHYELDLTLYPELFTDDLSNGFIDHFPYVIYQYFECRGINDNLAQNATHHLYESIREEDYLDFMLTLDCDYNAA